MTELRRTPLYENHKNLEAKFVSFAGWEMPISYSGIIEEHLAVRENVGLFDVSHMGEVFIEGKDALKYVDFLVTNDVSKLNVNQVLYTLMCYEHGGIVDDLLVYKFNDEKFLLVVNASNIEKDFEWMIQNKGSFQVEIENASNSLGQIAIQGRNAQTVLQKLVNIDLDKIKFFYFSNEVLINDIHCLVSRTGYTGEDGFEIYASNEDVSKLWNLLMESGKDLDIKPIGLGARDTLRFEASLPLYGNEIAQDINPLEAGLGFFVKLDTSFIGKEPLLRAKENGLTRKLVGLKLLGKGIPRHGYDVVNDEGNKIGSITTGYLLPNYDHGIALALIDVNNANLGNKVNVQIRKKQIEAEVISKNFMNKKYKK